jgi:ABC-type proline/glycine betaine transport system ATPase subunit
MGLSPLVLKSVFDAVRMMNKQGKTILLVEQNARAGLRLSTHGVVLENGRVRLAGSGREVLHHPEIGALYLGGAVTDTSANPATAPENANVAAANAAAAEIAAADAETGGSDPTAHGSAPNGGAPTSPAPNGGASNGTASNGTAAR